MGNLTPILTLECMPGDRFNIGADQLIRFAPIIAPVMHRFNATVHYFFVPHRLSWKNFGEFISQQGNHVHPYITLNEELTADQIKFLDYMGVPVPPLTTGQTIRVNPLPFAAYQLIYQEYYRDQNLIDPDDIELTDADNTTKLAQLLRMRKRAWEHDYFTAALPFAQKGADVSIPLGDVMLKDDATQGQLVRKASDNTLLSGVDLTVDGDSKVSANGAFPANIDPNGTLEVGATTINALRLAVKLQEWLERMARGGSRYIETILTQFGVKTPDYRLQRPEYITGVKSPIIISEVLNTAGGELPQGNMAGHAVGVSQGHSGSFFCQEHGYIIGIMSVMPKPAYMQGLHRTFTKLDIFDYPWPVFGHLGEQEIRTKEIFLQNDESPNQNRTFGYIPRYAEFKYMPSRVAGDFRNSLEYWHLARKFETRPDLNQSFIECNPQDLTRIFAVETDDDNLYCHVLHKIRAQRPLPVFGTPML